jgi:Flp pilus assembly protein TadB
VDVLALRVAFTGAATALCVWLLSSGRPLGGLIIVPALAVWVRRTAESGRLTRFAGRLAGPR